MHHEVDKAYFDRRAREAHGLAEGARDERIATIHRTMAQHYEARALALAEARPSRGHSLA